MPLEQRNVFAARELSQIPAVGVRRRGERRREFPCDHGTERTEFIPTRCRRNNRSGLRFGRLAGGVAATCAVVAALGGRQAR